MRDDEDLTDLIRAAAGGDRRAFEDLVLRKRDRVVRTAFQITGNLGENPIAAGANASALGSAYLLYPRSAMPGGLAVYPGAAPAVA